MRNILIEIAGRSLYQILAIRLIHALRHDFRIKDGLAPNKSIVIAPLCILIWVPLTTAKVRFPSAGKSPSTYQDTQRRFVNQKMKNILKNFAPIRCGQERSLGTI